VRVTGYLTAEFHYTTTPDWTIRDRSITWVLGIHQVPSCSAMGFLISTNIPCTVRGGFAPIQVTSCFAMDDQFNFADDENTN
jgi:hypothetical protein